MLPVGAEVNTLKPGSWIVILGSDNQPLFPMAEIQDNHSVRAGDKTINLTGVQDENLVSVVQELVGEQYAVNDVVRYSNEQLANITILGDIDSPGNYAQPLSASVHSINSYHGLYDDTLLDASITLIRQGDQTLLKTDQLNSIGIEPGDVYLFTLVKKTVEIRPIEPTPALPEPVDVVDVVDVDTTSQPLSAEVETETDHEPVVMEVPSDEVAMPESIETIISELMNNALSKHNQFEDNGMPYLIQNVEDIEPLAVDVTSETTQSELSESVTEEPVSDEETRRVTYLLKPGDVLTINLPEEEGFNEDFRVNRSGFIALPEMGQLKVDGLSLQEAETLIFDVLSDAFLGLDKLIVILKERRLLVTVLGYVEKPGEVELSSDGNIQTAINAAGGLQDGAQLNKLQLQRNGSITEFDYKKYLDSGDTSYVPGLQSLDTIFVPSSPDLSNVHGMNEQGGPSGINPSDDRSAIRVFGEVSRAGTIPYTEDLSIVDALLRVGGVTRYANVEQIRMIADGEPILFNLKEYLDVGDDDMLPMLKEGATIFVPKQVEAVKSGSRVVYVMGQVQKPGTFETGENVSFLDVIANAGGPNRYADTNMLRILRADGRVVRFDLQAYAEGSGEPLPDILPGDAIFVPEKSTLVDDSWLKIPTNSSVHMIGAVKKPGRYQWAEGINFMDMLAHAGGPTEKADIAHVRLVSTGPHGEAISREFNLQQFLDRGGNWNALPTLKGGVSVIFPELPEDPSDNKAQWIRLPSEQAIYIMGAVVTPGRYAFSDQMDVLDILSAAQGPKEEADLTNVRIIHRNGPAPRVSRLNLVEYFETGDETLLPEVSTGDSIFIPSRNRSWVQKKKDETIRVLGSVKNSGRYEFDSEMTILDVLAESGGPTNTAYIEKIIIVNSSCCDNQAYTFDLMDFMKDPDVSRLPVLRPGDTVYVPDVSNTQWSYFIDVLADTLSIVSFVSLTKALIGGSAL